MSLAGACLSLAACGPPEDLADARFPLGAPASPGAVSAERAADSVLVRFRAAPDRAARLRSLSLVGGAIRDADRDAVDDRFAHIAGGELAVVHLGAGTDAASAIAALRRDPAVLYAEPNFIVRASGKPNDARFPELHALHNLGQLGGTPDADIDAPEAWDITVGSRRVVVGVVDTGIDLAHEDLAANLWVNPGEIAGNGQDDDANGVVDDVHGFNAISGGGDAFDDNGHGTHVAGTIGAVGNNRIGVVGVNWSVRLMSLKFLSSTGAGTLADAIAAIDYAVAQRQAGVPLRILSNSWGGAGFSQALLDAIESAGDAGILFVASAGGDSTDIDVNPSYPASYEAASVVSVAATDADDELAAFSSFGASSVDLAAPGVGILSTFPGNTYERLSGTSMAVPHVAGVAALILAVRPRLELAPLVRVLLTTGDPLPALEGITVSGRRLNARAALAFIAATAR